MFQPGGSGEEVTPMPVVLRLRACRTWHWLRTRREKLRNVLQEFLAHRDERAAVCMSARLNRTVMASAHLITTPEGHEISFRT